MAERQLGEKHVEAVPLKKIQAWELEAARREEGWVQDDRSRNPLTGQWLYHWRYAPMEALASKREGRRAGVLAVLVVAVIAFVLASTIITNNGGGGSSAPAPYVPMNSEGKPAVGPIPAPADDPCWRQVEEAVEISPSDGGQSAMPQRCIDKGF